MLIHDNAKEFVEGEFETICKIHGIDQTRSPPFEPNKNPVELYMDILVSMTRSMLYISSLDPVIFWSHALEHAAYLQLRCALYPIRIDVWPTTQRYQSTDVWL